MNGDLNDRFHSDERPSIRIGTRAPWQKELKAENDQPGAAANPYLGIDVWTMGRGHSLPVFVLVLLDVLGLAAALGAFWLLHIKISSTVETPINLSTAAITAPARPTASATGRAGAKVTPTPTATPDAGMWGAKFADKFAAGAPVKTANSYRSKDVSVSLEKVQADGVTYYWADIYIRNLQNFRTAFGQGTPGKTDTTVNTARANNAILAISGDYFSAHPKGIVIRNGKLYRESAFEDVLVMNNDGSMQTFSAEEFDIEKVKRNGAWQAWSFGPMLLDDGKPMEKFNSTVSGANPRCAVGYYEPGHYCFVLVDGRQPGYSTGMTMKALSKLFYDKGCKAAYNLDGGQTAVMAFQGELANRPYNGGRKVSDILYIGER